MSAAARSLRPLRLAAVLLLTACACGAPRALAAELEAARPAAWLDEVTLDGFLSTAYSYNFNRPDSRSNQLRVFDLDDNSFKLDVFELVLQRPIAKPREAGFRVDLELGGSVPRVSSSRGLFRTDSTAEDIDLQQAYLSWIAPVGSGLRIDAGKFITHHGYEVIEGYDGWNDNATRSLLFGFAIPFTHTGARATYGFSRRVTGMLVLVNGWDVADDNNRSKSVGGQLALTPAASLAITVNAMVGPERADRERDPRTLLDGTLVWKAGDRVTLGANADWGRERGAVAAGEVARWTGAAGYARLTSGDRALSLRAELFDDHDGARTGTAQRLTEWTLTPEARLAPHLLVRADLRVDHSDHRPFEKRGGATADQPTVLLDLLYSF